MTEAYNPYRKGTVLAPSGPHNHLHIICSDPIYNKEFGCDCVLVVNICSVPTSGKHDSACVLQAGEHSFIKHPSYLLYRLSVLWRVPVLCNKVDSGEYITYDDINEATFKKIIQGFSVSDFTPFKVVRFMEKNKLI